MRIVCRDAERKHIGLSSRAWYLGDSEKDIQLKRRQKKSKTLSNYDQILFGERAARRPIGAILRYLFDDRACLRRNCSTNGRAFTL